MKIDWFLDSLPFHNILTRKNVKLEYNILRSLLWNFRIVDTSYLFGKFNYFIKRLKFAAVVLLFIAINWIREQRNFNLH